MAKYINGDLQRASKLAFKLFVQGQKQAQCQITPLTLEPQETPPKAWFPDLYYSSSHMDCYQFCQQYKNYFKTAGAKKPYRIQFAALFLRWSVT